jgi:hypothetical protein
MVPTHPKNIKHLFLRAILALLLLSPAITAQVNNSSKTETDRMILAYTFYIKQKISLEFIAEQYPALQEYTTLATNEWNREFRPSIENIDSILTHVLKDKWTAEKAAMIYKFSKADNSGIKEEDAKKFIYTASERSSGRIQTPILETFLVYSPTYQKKPEMEFSDGYVKKVATKELRPSFPLNLKITYPRSWKETINKKGNSLLKCTSGYGIGPVSMDVTIVSSRNEYTRETVTKLLSQETMQKLVPANGKMLAYTPDVTMYNCPSASITFYQKNQQPESKIATITEMYTSYYKNSRITISFSVSSASPNPEELNLVFKKHRKLFIKIIENIVILSQWGL